MNKQTNDSLAKILWNYNCLSQPIRKADVIVVLGSNDIRVAEYGSQLFKQHYAPLLVFSGNEGRLTRGIWNRPEAEVFAKIAIEHSVPKEKILIENRSTNTGENVLFTKQLLKEKKLDIDSLIAVHKPYMGRRTNAIFKKVWPEIDIMITAPDVSFEEYPNEIISEELLINILVGDTQRIKLYAEKGFQIPQEIPEHVWQAYEELVKRGFTKHLINT